MKYCLITLFTMSLILFCGCATTKASFYYSTAKDNKISGDTIIIDLKISWSEQAIYFWPLKHVSDSSVLFSKKLFNPWLGLKGPTKFGWCPIDSVTSKNSKIINLGADKYKIETKIGVIPDSGRNSIDIYTYGCSKKFENNIKIENDSVTISNSYKKEITKR